MIKVDLWMDGSEESESNKSLPTNFLSWQMMTSYNLWLNVTH